MNRIEKLIAELCPNGVEWKKLGEVCNFQNGFAFKSNLFKDSGLPIIRITNINGKNVDLNDLKYFEPSDYKEDLEKFKINKGDILIAMSGATTGKIGYYDVEDIAYLNQRVGKFSPKKEVLNNRFLYHFLNLNYQKIFLLSGGGAQPNLSSIQLMENIPIPIPPLPIQEEIVKILDTFTELEAELEAQLEAELEARKKQYEYYRNKLLTPVEHNGRWFLNGKEVEWKKLGEIGTLIRGSGLQKKDFVPEGVGCIHYGQIYTYYGTFADRTISFVSEETAKNLKKVSKGDLVITSTSENIEDVCKSVAWVGDNEIVTGGHAVILKHHENAKFLSYYFQTRNFFIQKIKYAKGTKVIDISVGDLAKIPIPIPPLSEQERIVAILDKFDALVNDLTAGLPAEIKARRKQYEYYRNKLLNFNRYHYRIDSRRGNCKGDS